MALEAALLGAVPAVVIDLIKALISIATTAVRCREECQRLKDRLEAIEPGVVEIGHQLRELRSYDPYIKLKSVDDWVEVLKKELDLATITVDKCNSASRLGRHVSVFSNAKLTKKLTAHHDEITKLAEQRATLNIQLTALTRQEQSRPSEVPIVWRKYVAEVNDIKRREEFTRVSQRERDMSDSVHYGYGSSGRLFYAEDSSHHSSSSSYPTPPHHRSSQWPHH